MNSAELSEVIAWGLDNAGADTVFGMPGGGNNLDFIGAAEAAGMRFVLAHAETPAAIMASVYGDLTDTPAVCVVTRGPGAASTVNGVANALLDRQQLVLVTDAVSTADYERIAHQWIDQRAMFEPVTKRSVTVGEGDPAATVVAAVADAMAPPRGPVHLDFDPAGFSTVPPAAPEPDETQPADVDRLCRLLRNAHRPVVLLGVGARAVAGSVRSLLDGSAVPVLMTYRAKGVIPDSVGNAAGLLTGATTEAPLLHAADLIVAIGVDSVELIPNAWPYAAPIISVSAWHDTSPYLKPDVAVVGELEKLIAVLAEHWPSRASEATGPEGVRWAASAGNDYRDAEQRRLLAAGSKPVAGLSPQEVVQRARMAAPPGTIATVDAGAHMLCAMSLWSAEAADETVISSGLATMGYALPAAIAASLARPGRPVVCFTGDGGLGMCLGELETLRRLGLPVTIVVFNDARLSLIAIKAKPHGNGGENAVVYERTDFAAVAAGYGLRAARADTSAELDSALADALAGEGPALIDAMVDPSGYPEILAAIRGRRHSDNDQ
jgi:acetolactate synthase-1/2/3 large subunit